MPASPGDFAYWRAGEPFRFFAKSSTGDMQYWRAGELFPALIAAAAGTSVSDAAPINLQAVVVSTADRSLADTVPFNLAAVATNTVDRVKAATVPLNLAAVPSNVADRIASVTASIGLQPSPAGSLTGSQFNVSTSAQLGIQPSPSAARDRTTSVLATFNLQPSPAAPANISVSVATAINFAALPSVQASALYLGRYRRGDKVNFSFTLPGIPDSPPVLTISSSGGASVVMQLATTDNTGLHWGREVILGCLYFPGYLHTATLDYSIGGTAGQQAESFDCVVGGDSGGSVISIWSYNRPGDCYILAQLESGQLVQGRNPHL